MTVSGNEPGQVCIFPFIQSDGVEWTECTERDADQPWCATEVDSDGNIVTGKWGNCDTEKCSWAGKGID